MAAMDAKASVFLIVVVLGFAVLSVLLIAALGRRRPSSGHSGSRAAWVFATIFILLALSLAGFFAVFTVRVDRHHATRIIKGDRTQAPAYEVYRTEAEYTGEADVGGGDFEQWQKANALAPAAEEKPWLGDPSGLQGQIVGYSGLEPEDASKPHAREAARASARESAERSAVKRFETLLLARIKGGHEVGSSVSPQVNESMAGEKIRGRLPSLVLDRYEQEFPGKSANLRYHRAAVLVRADPESLASMTRELEESLRRQVREVAAHRSTVITTVASALGLAFVVFLLYSFLNAGTKGHFAWPLRIISVATLIAVYLGLMYVKGWFPR